MEDNIVKFREDIQECIADNKDDFSNCYGAMFFDKNSKFLKQSLGCFQSLTISPCNDRLKFDGIIAEDLEFTDEEMLSIQKQAWQYKMKKYNKKIEEKNKTAKQKHNEAVLNNMKLSQMFYNEKEPDFRKPTSLDLGLISLVKKGLISVDLNFSFEEYKETLLLTLNTKEITLNINQLRTIHMLSNKLDFLFIIPTYSEDEYSEKALGIKIAMGINLAKEK